jgi:CRISPR-associated protein Cmr5
MSNQRTLEQERASAAWKFIQELPESIRKEYASLAKKAPADIQTNGLGQTLAFWRAKGFDNQAYTDKAECKIYEHISQWLGDEKRFNIEKEINTENRNGKTVTVEKKWVIHWITDTANTTDYRRATAETIAILLWVKRFAESDLPS